MIPHVPIVPSEIACPQLRPGVIWSSGRPSEHHLLCPARDTFAICHYFPTARFPTGNPARECQGVVNGLSALPEVPPGQLRRHPWLGHPQLVSTGARPTHQTRIQTSR